MRQEFSSWNNATSPPISAIQLTFLLNWVSIKPCSTLGKLPFHLYCHFWNDFLNFHYSEEIENVLISRFWKELLFMKLWKPTMNAGSSSHWSSWETFCKGKEGKRGCVAQRQWEHKPSVFWWWWGRFSGEYQRWRGSGCCVYSDCGPWLDGRTNQKRRKKQRLTVAKRQIQRPNKATLGHISPVYCNSFSPFHHPASPVWVSVSGCLLTEEGVETSPPQPILSDQAGFPQKNCPCWGGPTAKNPP